MSKPKAHIIQEQIDTLYNELKEIQKRCKHLKATKKYNGNSGHFCSADDSYWIDCYCPTCLKKWVVYDYEEEYFNNKYNTIDDFLDI